MTTYATVGSSTDTSMLALVPHVAAGSHVLEAAVERAELEEASLVVLHVMPMDEYASRQRSRETIRELRYDGFTFDMDQAAESAESVAKRAAHAAIGDRDIPYTTVGRVGGLVSTVLAVAAAYNCTTILLPETESWWRRVTGRADRQIAKRFDGTVVRVPRPFPDNLETVRQLPVARPKPPA